jgi:hypothetical protein
MPLTALRHVRKMRGGAQAHLLEADDGCWYVVKFRNNPQHRRILVNELVSCVILEYLGVAAPAPAIIHVPEELLAQTPELHFAVGGSRVPVEPGWHFGSRYPGDPNMTAVYDFLPDALLAKVANLEDFRAILVFDKWVSNADGRQSVFFRARVRRGEESAREGFVVRMIDHGFAFNGPNWDFPDGPLQGLYPRRMVYETVRSLDDFQPWLDQVLSFPEEVVDRAWKTAPPEWLDGDEDAFDAVLSRLLERRKRTPDLLASCRSARSNPFPNWR